MNAEAGDDFVEDQSRAGFLSDLANLLHEFARLKIWVTTLNGFHKHGGEFIGVGANPFEGVGSAVVENYDVADAFSGDAGSDGQGARRACGFHTFHKNFVKHTVIQDGKEDHLGAAGNGASHAKSGDYRFRTGIAEGHALITGHFAEHLGDFAGERRHRPDLEAFLELLCNGLFDEIRTMTEHDGAEAVENVDVFVAVDVPETRALGAIRKNGIDDFFPLRAETGNHPRIGEVLTVFLRQALR